VYFSLLLQGVCYVLCLVIGEIEASNQRGVRAHTFSYELSENPFSHGAGYCRGAQLTQ
jgi:hypothetical protein